MPWYAYVAFLVLAVIGYYVIVEIKQKALKEKKLPTERRKGGGLKSPSPQRKPGHANKLEFLKNFFKKLLTRGKICYIN